MSVNIEEISIIIPTWNSMPELKQTLSSLENAFPKGVIKEIIIVDKESTDGTIEYAKTYGCIIITDTKSLGSARLTGLNYADTTWVAFIDSDIKLPEGWFEEMIFSVNNRYLAVPDNIGWIYGRTIDDISPLREEKLYKMKMELTVKGRTVKHRAYTNNTICLRKPLLNADIEELNAWEDYIMTQCMLDAGYEVIEFPIICTHIRSETYDKFGLMTEAWGIAGELKAKGINIRTLLRPFWFLYWGVKTTVHFKDINHFRFNLSIFLSMIKALFKLRESFTWSRER